MKPVLFSWDASPSEYVETYNLYEIGPDGPDLLIDKIGVLNFTLQVDGEYGVRTYYVTAVDKFGNESVPSNTVEYNYHPPMAPANLTISGVDSVDG